MLNEGKMLTAFDAMEAAMKLSNVYIAHKQKDVINFRYSHSMEAVVFEFGFWKGYEYTIRKSFTIYLDNTPLGQGFGEFFEEVEKETERITRYDG